MGELGEFVRPQHIFIVWVDDDGNMHNYTCKHDGLSVDGKIQLHNTSWKKYIPELPYTCFPLSITPLFDGNVIGKVHPSLMSNSLIVSAFTSYKDKDTGDIRYPKISLPIDMTDGDAPTYIRINSIYEIKRELQKFTNRELRVHIDYNTITIVGIIPTNQNFPKRQFTTRIN